MNIAENKKGGTEAKKATLNKLMREQSHSKYRLKSAQHSKITEDVATKIKVSWNNEVTNAKYHRKISSQNIIAK